jgi:hypothetical protein
MDGAVATLQMAARELQLADATDRSKYAAIVSQLRAVAEQLTALERRTGAQKAEAINLAAMLRDAAASVAATAERAGEHIALELPDEAMVEGPARDLRNSISGVVEYAITVGCDAITLRIDRDSARGRNTCVSEFTVRSRDVPDFLQRNLWKAVSIRRGEVSIVCEAQSSRIRFKLPIECRLNATVQ